MADVRTPGTGMRAILFAYIHFRVFMLIEGVNLLKKGTLQELRIYGRYAQVKTDRQ
jgi:hypothetical protein